MDINEIRDNMPETLDYSRLLETLISWYTNLQANRNHSIEHGYSDLESISGQIDMCVAVMYSIDMIDSDMLTKHYEHEHAVRRRIREVKNA